MGEIQSCCGVTSSPAAALPVPAGAATSSTTSGGRSVAAGSSTTSTTTTTTAAALDDRAALGDPDLAAAAAALASSSVGSPALLAAAASEADSPDARYWNGYYTAHSEPRDWYQGYGAIRDLVRKQIQHQARVLHVGCGSSNLAAELFRDGFTSIDNIDISAIGIFQQRERWEGELAGVTWTQDDACSICRRDNTYDCVVEKGCFDFLCGQADGLERVAVAVAEAHRVLRDNGVLISISHSHPMERRALFDSFDWTVTTTDIERMNATPRDLMPRLPPTATGRERASHRAREVNFATVAVKGRRGGAMKK